MNDGHALALARRGCSVLVNYSRSQDEAEATAAEIGQLFPEVVIAPEVTPAALEIFSAKPNLRVLETGAMADPAAPGMTVKSVARIDIRQPMMNSSSTTPNSANSSSRRSISSAR